MPITVKFDPTANSTQAQIIQNATANTDGVMSAADKAALETLKSLVGDGFNILFRTTDGTPQIAKALTMPVNTTLNGKVTAEVITDDGVGHAVWSFPVYAFSDGATITQLSMPGGGIPILTDVGFPDLSVINSGLDIQFQATGLGGTPLNWRLTFSFLSLSH